MRRNVKFERAATEEFRQAKCWYRQHAGDEIVKTFIDEFDRAVTRVANAPERWPIYERPFRWFKVRRFPYLLIYQVIDEETVLVVAVAHECREPGYWRNRH